MGSQAESSVQTTVTLQGGSWAIIPPASLIVSPLLSSWGSPLTTPAGRQEIPSTQSP